MSAARGAAVPLLDAPSLRAALDGFRQQGRRVALVPTMGALHEGHRALVREARRLADAVVVSVFVNPLQFGPGEDLARYPRTWDADLAACREEGADAVYAPSAQDVYPEPPQVTVSAGRLGTVLEGASRPGHFDGVLTVVAKLFARVRPDVAVFGEKDFQQLVLVRRMVADLDLGVDVVGLPTVRDADGLALSSRNAYLSPDERRSALTLSRALRAGAACAGQGRDAVLAAARAELETTPGVALDYLALAGTGGSSSTPDLDLDATAGPARLLVAARVGSTRLIDNVGLTLPAGPTATEGR